MSEELAPPPDIATDVPFDEDIARLAYPYYEEENRPDGRADEHWHRAAQVLRGAVPPWTVESSTAAPETAAAAGPPKPRAAKVKKHA